MASVFVHGVGAVSALGHDWPTTARRLAAGESAIAPVTRFDAEGFPCSVAAEVAMETSDDEDRRVTLARRAAAEAWAHAGMRSARLGVFIGAEAGRPSLDTLRACVRGCAGGFDHRAFHRHAAPLAARIAPSLCSPAAVASVLAREVAARGPVETISLACASGSAAVIEAVRAIRLGLCDAALAGGVGADIDPLMFAGFGQLGALSESGRSRPFDVHRDGFVLGEGAAMVVLAQTPAPCAIVGIGRSLDAWRLTAPDPEGRGAEAAMRRALADAGVDAVDYVQAHGTSTPLNDAVEARALRRVMPLDRARLGSVKGALGHWIAGAGALGVLCAYEAVVNGTMLPTAGLRRPDPDCDLPHILERAEQGRVTTALVNAFAFGGANCSIVLRAA